MVSVEDFHEGQVVVLLVGEGYDEEDVLVLVELVRDRRRQVGLHKSVKLELSTFILFKTC